MIQISNCEGGVPSVATMSTEDLLEKYGRPVPRYTSYPTAPHFHDGITDATYHGWLSDLPAAAALSLYVHIPYCDTLCWFCGCQMQHVRRYQPIADYLPVLKREISSVAALVGERGVTHIHWGGGSPTILETPDITGLADAIRDAFTVSPAVEFAVEIDPRGFDQDRAKALAAGG
ncbi:MAG: coproporphyrinogen III oxidase, partial [Alphaproteobacteria bacterium]